ncbi:MAG: hemerythrin domain-containing protein [Verrucomicrobia bacterium]|jgi:hemerythrin-like domain-containing protein|nr:hemerythrin domain-containing protein [Verrucomicrobiota bacterium]
MKITEALIAEHGVFHGLFDYIERTTPSLKTLAEVKAVAGLLDATLVPHSRVEEELFIEPLDHCMDQLGQTKHFHGEHEEIEATLAKIQQCKSAASARNLLLDAVRACRSHFDKEERIVFPMGERLLKAKTLNALGGEWQKRREAATW